MELNVDELIKKCLRETIRRHGVHNDDVWSGVAIVLSVLISMCDSKEEQDKALESFKNHCTEIGKIL